MKTRSPKPALEQQALGTGPADRGFETVLLKDGGKPTAQPTSIPLVRRQSWQVLGLLGRGWSWGWPGHGTAFCSRPSHWQKGPTGEKGKVPGLEAVEEDAVFSFTEWRPVCFGKLYKGARRGGERGREKPGALNEAFPLEGKTSQHLHSLTT